MRSSPSSPLLPTPQLSALRVLVDGGPRTQGELAAEEGVRPPSMTKTVQALEQAGMVRRIADPADARVAILHATARGRRTLKSGEARRMQMLIDLMSELEAADVLTLEEASRLIRQMIDSHAELSGQRMQ